MSVQRIETARGHRYTIDGADAPGVTSIIGAAVPKEALPRWASRSVATFVAEALDVADGEVSADAGPLLTAIERVAMDQRRPLKRGSRESIANTLAGVPWLDRDTAANRGVEVHDLAARITRGEEVEVPDVLDLKVASFEEWVARWQPRDELVERTVANRDPLYCGTFDLIATLVDGRRWLLDLKTTRSGVYGEVALQLAGYRWAQVLVEPDGSEAPMPPVDACGVVWLTDFGFVMYEATVGPRQWQQFVRCCHTARYLGDYGKADAVLHELTHGPSIEVAS